MAQKAPEYPGPTACVPREVSGPCVCFLCESLDAVVRTFEASDTTPPPIPRSAVYGPDKLVPAGGSPVPLAPVGSLAFHSDAQQLESCIPTRCSFSAVLLLLHTRSDHATLPPMSPGHLAAPLRVVSHLPPVILHLSVFTLCDLDQFDLSLIWVKIK